MLDLAPEDLALTRAILSAHLPGARVRAFGSRVTGKARPFSDLDLVVLADEVFTEPAFREARQALEDSNLPIRVDLLRWSQMPLSIRQTIATTGVDFSGKQASGLS